KPDACREAVARGRVVLRPYALTPIARRKIPKGDVFTTARLAAIMATKRVDGLIPVCHPLCLTHVAIDFATQVRNSRIIDVIADSGGRAGEVTA
ncbi:MAG: cyclic pyranopterin monophosphate synthase MoaC, partial [bacterium]